MNQVFGDDIVSIDYLKQDLYNVCDFLEDLDVVKNISVSLDSDVLEMDLGMVDNRVDCIVKCLVVMEKEKMVWDYFRFYVFLI